MRPLSPDDYRLWQIWVADRERFRQIGVRGGANGELGQGQWSLRPWGQGGGFEEWYPFDGFLGKMGPYERKEVKGLEALYEALGSDEEGPQDGVVGANTDGNEVGLGGEGGEMAEEKAEGKSEMELEPQAKSKAEATGDAKLEAMGEVKEDTKADGSGTGGTKKKNKKKGKKGKGQKEVEEKGQGAE